MKRFGAVRAVALVVGFALTQAVSAVAVEYSMQMPLAANSLLLDVTSAGSRLVAVGERGHILTSEDEGASWTQIRVPTTVMLTRVFFVDDLRGWAVGHDGNVLHSQDGGITWVMQRDGLADQVQINEQRAGRWLAQTQSLTRQLALASDEAAEDIEAELADAQWALDNAREALDQPVYAPPLMDVWFATPEQGWAVGAYGTLLRTDNGGRDWADWSHHVDNPEELHLNGVVGDRDGMLYLVSEWGLVFVSRNGGDSWEAQETGYDGSFFGVLAHPGGEGVFAYGLLGTVYRSRNQGSDWEELDAKVTASLFGAAAEGDTLVFVGQGGTATLTSDGGDSFTPLIQAQRDGLFGVTPLGGDRFVATGEGGSRLLVKANPGRATR